MRCFVYLPEAEFEVFEGISHDIPTEVPRRTANTVHTFATDNHQTIVKGGNDEEKNFK